MRLLRYLSEFVEELILLGIIVLNIFDFLEMINPDFDYLKKIISLTAMGYLLYKAGLSRLFFGTRSRKSDFLIVISYFMLSFKNILGFSVTAIRELQLKGAGYWARIFPVQASAIPGKIVNITSPLSSVDLGKLQNIPVGSAMDNLTRSFTITPGIPLHVNEIYARVTNDMGSALFLIEPRYLIQRWHNLLIDNMASLERFAVIAGLVLLIFIAVYSALRQKITAPSLMHVIREEGDPPKSLGRLMSRALIIFIVLNFFYIAVFNLMMEWLGLAIDAPLLVTGIFFYLLVWVKHHKRFSPENIIYRIGSIGESFYERFISLFQSQEGILFGISGMLVLHMLTDIGNFIVPYITGIHDPMYFSYLGAGHTPVFSLTDLVSPEKTSLYFMDISHSAGMVDKLGISYVYLFNIIAVLLVFAGPAFIWYIIFSKKFVDIPSVVLGVFFSSVACILLSPVFTIGRLSSNSIVGVDITTHGLSPAGLPLVSVIIISLLVGIIVFALSLGSWARTRLILGSVGIMLLSFGLYIFFFFIDTSSYYINAITQSFGNDSYIIGLYFLLFLTLTIVFYVGGFFIYIYEIFKSG